MSEVTYKIYMHTIKNTGKSYIGYTGKGIIKRLDQHWKNMQRGIDTHFYRALRKYGLASLQTTELATTKSKAEALIMEKKYILQFDTFNSGYNMTIGGDGGDVINQMSTSRLAKWKQDQKIRSGGLNNGNCSGATDEMLVEHAAKIAKKYGRLTRGMWKSYASSADVSLPQNIGKSQFRFDGKGFDGLRRAVEISLSLRPGSLKYIDKSKEHIEKIRATLRDKAWVTNGHISKYINKVDIKKYLSQGYWRGRILKNA